MRAISHLNTAAYLIHTALRRIGCSGRMPFQANFTELKLGSFAAAALLSLIVGCGSTNTQSVTPPVNASLNFSAIPAITASLGTQISTVNLSNYVQGGSAPYSYSLISQTASNTIAVALSGATLSSDYAYRGGSNTIAIQVTDSAHATATSAVTVTVPVPSVAAKVFGIDFSPYEAGQSPSVGAIGISQLTQRIGAIAPYTQWIRSYSSTNGLENVGAIGHKFGLKVCMGAAIGSDTSANGANATEMANLIQHALNGEADCAVVGTEALFNMYVTPSQLMAYINQFRAAVSNVPVATSDTYFELLTTPSVVNDGDFLFVNYYPYWEGVDISVALADLNAEDALLRLTYPGFANNIWISETGWPSGGNTVANQTGTMNAVPSPANAASYFLDFESWGQSGQRKTFYFEGFDEAWKATSTAPQQALFGIFDQTGTMKYGSNVFAGQTQSDNWTCTIIPGGAGTSTVQLTPPIPPRLPVEPPNGSVSLLQGQALHINPATSYVVVYIHVGSAGWYVKPYLTAPLTILNCDGTWTANIDTGGSDATADQVAAFVIPSTYSPPLLQGAQTLPTALYSNAIANVIFTRP